MTVPLLASVQLCEAASVLEEVAPASVEARRLAGIEREAFKEAKMARVLSDSNNGKEKRVKRYETLSELRTAVRARCITEVDRITGEPGAGEEVAARVRAEVDIMCPNGRVDDRPRRVWRDLMRALAAAADFMAPNPRGPWRSKYELHIAMFFNPERFVGRQLGAGEEEFSLRQCAQIRNALGALAADHATAGLEDMNRRTVIVALYDQALLWWIAREPKPRPTARELAIITLLAGEFPEHANRLRKEGRCPTVADVLKAETRATREARKRLDLWRVEGFIKSERARDAARGGGHT